MPSRQFWPVCTRNISFGSAFFKAYFHLIRVFFLRLQSGYNTNLKCPKLSTWASTLCWQCPYFPASWGQTPSIPGPPAANGMASDLGMESSSSHLCAHSRPRCNPSSLQVFQLVSCLGPHPHVCISTAPERGFASNGFCHRWEYEVVLTKACVMEFCICCILRAPPPMAKPSPPWGLCLSVTLLWPSDHPVEKCKSKSYCTSHFLFLSVAMPRIYSSSLPVLSLSDDKLVRVGIFVCSILCCVISA